jgi:hypothetical protein
MFSEVPMICNRVKQAENVLSPVPVEPIRKYGIRAPVIERQLNFGIVHDDLSGILNSKFAADLHRNL